MDEIYEPNKTFDFDKLILIKPIMINGGNFFIRILKNDAPLYIQPPKCILKQGIVKAGRKLYCDLIFSNDDDSFISWVENLENSCQKNIYNNREKWFETELEMHDIENSFTSTLKIFKSGKNYILRVNVPNVLGKCTLKIYDEDENEIESDNINDNADVMSILEFKGIKCSARSFQIDIEMKQLMILKPKKIFDKCILKTNKSIENVIKNDSRLSSNILEDAESKNNSKVPFIDTNDLSIDKQNAQNTTDIIQNIENKLDHENLKENNEQSLNNDNDDYDSKDITDNKIKLQEESETETELSKSKEIDNIRNNIDCNDNKINISNTENNNDVETPVNIKNSYIDTLEEIDIDLNLDRLDSEDVVQLKKRNDVYYEMYRDAINKAKTARDLALSNYLEAKRIKNTYLLIDDENENFEDDLNF